MQLVKKTYLVALKSLLLAGYFVFFISQFNARYYDAANYFVYKTGSLTAAASAAPARPKAAHFIGRHLNKHKSGYLSLDKRFVYSPAIQPVFFKATPPPSILVITRKFAAPKVVYYSSEYLSTNALRGPPCA